MRFSLKRSLPFLLTAALVGCNTTPQNSSVSSQPEPEIVESADIPEEATEKELNAEKAPSTDAEAASKPIEKPKDTPKAIAPALQPGMYCYEFSDNFGEEVVRLTVDSSDRIIGDLQGGARNPAEGYSTSYRSKIDGTIDGSNLNVDVATWIEYDRQNSQETWRVSPNELKTDRETLSQADCEQANKAFQNENGIEAKDLTAYANRVKTEQVYFEAGKSGTTVSDSVVRGDRDVYTLNAQGGQQMYLSISSLENNAVFDVVDPSGIVLGTEVTDDMFFLPHTGAYEIIVGGTRGNATYELAISIE